MQTKEHKAKNKALYELAVARAGKQQPFLVYADDTSPLLLTAPNSIIFELFGTILFEQTSEKLEKFVEVNLELFLSENWRQKTVRRAVERLRRECAIDASLSSDQNHSKTDTSLPLLPVGSPTHPVRAKDIAKHIIYRLKHKLLTQISSLILKLALDEGYRSQKLKAEAFYDVQAAFKDWRQSKLIKLYAFGNAPADEQQLICSSTTVGSLAPWIANYVDGSDKKRNVDLIQKLSSALRDKTKNCIYLTNDLRDAFTCAETQAIRCSLLLLRNQSHPKLPKLNTQDEALVKAGKVYFISSLRCVSFVPDEANNNCC